METVGNDSMISSTHGDVLKELHEKLTERRQVFMKRSIELARKQAWYRSVALGKHRRQLLCWMLGTIFKTLKVIKNNFISKSFNIYAKINKIKFILIGFIK